MNRIVKTCIASVVSEIQQSDLYLTVKARLFETPGANLNGVRVTYAFLSEIVDHEEKYVGLPLYADVKALANGNYKHLGHLYDARTGEFHSAQIGSFVQFELEETADGAALIGYARIMKRNKAVCRAISELFADGALKFSFEISCGSYRELEDGTIEIDISDDNYLEGMAVVSFPACESAVALDLVAECARLTDDCKEGETAMTDIENTAVIAEQDEERKEPEAQVETASAEVEDASAEVETASEESHEETAALIVEDRHVSVDDTSIYNTEDGSRVEEHIVHETTTVTPLPDPESVLAPDNGIAVVEFAESEPEEKPEEECSECSDEHKKENAEMKMETAIAALEALAKLVGELQISFNDMKHEIAEWKENTDHVVAEAQVSTIAQNVNPFIAEISVPDNNSRYGLLDSDETDGSEYTLL